MTANGKRRNCKDVLLILNADQKMPESFLKATIDEWLVSAKSDERFGDIITRSQSLCGGTLVLSGKLVPLTRTATISLVPHPARLDCEKWAKCGSRRHYDQYFGQRVRGQSGSKRVREVCSKDGVTTLYSKGNEVYSIYPKASSTGGQQPI
jgi:hypothetical protein